MALSDVPLDLLRQCKDGDRKAFEDLYGLIRLDLYRIVYSYMRDHDDADEVLQESLIRMYRHFGGLKELQKFPSWAMRIMVNQCHTHRVRKSRHSYTPIEEVYGEESSQQLFRTSENANPREALVKKELLQKIENKIDELPARQRMAILLFEVSGLSIREVAQSMKCSEGAVKFNIHQARRKLQESLASDWKALMRRPWESKQDRAEKLADG